jgi:hypothetical protein
MAARLICRRAVLARASARKAWVFGTLYVHEDDLRFDRGANAEPTATHLRWAEVSSVCWRPGFPFGRVEIVRDGGVETYLCFGAKRLAGRLEALRAACSAPEQMRLAA